MMQKKHQYVSTKWGNVDLKIAFNVEASCDHWERFSKFNIVLDYNEIAQCRNNSRVSFQKQWISCDYWNATLQTGDLLYF